MLILDLVHVFVNHAPSSPAVALAELGEEDEDDAAEGDGEGEEVVEEDSGRSEARVAMGPIEETDDLYAVVEEG